jgi:hypothetical protein
MKLKKSTVVHYFLFVLIAYMIVLGLPNCKSAVRGSHNAGISNAVLEKLKTKTVLFILPEKEEEYIEDYKTLLPLAWTLTPITIIKYRDLASYIDNDSYAYFKIGAISRTNSQSNGFSFTNTHYFLTLSIINSIGKKGKITSDDLCRIELYPEFYTTNYNIGRKDVNNVIYTKSIFRNFTLPYMMAYLRFVQKNIQNNNNPWVYDNYKDNALRVKLGKDILYVPDSLIFNRDKFTGKESKKDANFFNNYPGKYKYVSTKELIDIIKTNTEKPVFLFEYVLSSTDKYVGVLEINSGTVVYRKYTGMTYNIKEKDLDDIIN